MKYLIIIGIVTIIFYALLYWRLRPYIATARRILGIVRDLRRAGGLNEQVAASPRGGGAGESLVRCDVCGVWIPSARALRLRSSASSYCSHACLENAAQKSERKAAGRGQ